MRFLRVLTLATCVVALFARPSAAQEGRQFKDAWFWGAKVGALQFSSEANADEHAPLVGGEWLITRTRGGLYVSFDQTYMTTKGGFAGRDALGNPMVNMVSIANLRRFTAAAMVFPMQTPYLHPYAGLGFTFYQIGHANLDSGTPSPAQADSIQQRKTTASPVGIVGAQIRLLRLSVFGQAFASPTQTRFFLSNSAGSHTLMTGVEVGIRYNIGSAIDRNR